MASSPLAAARPPRRPRALLAALALVAALAAAAPRAAEASSSRNLLAAPRRAPPVRPPAYCLYMKQSTTKACQGWQDAMCQYLNTTADGCLASAISKYSLNSGSGQSATDSGACAALRGLIYLAWVYLSAAFVLLPVPLSAACCKRRARVLCPASSSLITPAH